MSSNWQKDVQDFREKCGLGVNYSPSVPSEDTIRLDLDLIREEVTKELIPVLERLANKGTWDSQDFVKDLAELADALADSIYVIHGTAVGFGIQLQPIWDSIQEANMKKFGGPVRGDGKILKPEGWKHPDVKKLIEEQFNVPKSSF